MQQTLKAARTASVENYVVPERPNLCAQRGRLPTAVAEHFWAKVDRGPGCWLWTASRLGSGPGQFRVGKKMQQAHRVAWELTYGSPPPAFLRSTCGNLHCVRPDHRVVADRMGGASNLARTADRRFEAMVEKGPGCWQWIGSTTGGGYGQFSVMVPGEGRRMIPAHRFAWEQAYGAISAGADVVHTCGNRVCVRPDHLRVQDPDEASRWPTPRELDVLRTWVRQGGRYRSVKRAAEELGLAYGTVASKLWDARKRLDARSTRAAVTWLDEHMPGWRN